MTDSLKERKVHKFWRMECLRKYSSKTDRSSLIFIIIIIILKFVPQLSRVIFIPHFKNFPVQHSISIIFPSLSHSSKPFQSSSSERIVWNKWGNEEFYERDALEILKLWEWWWFFSFIPNPQLEKHSSNDSPFSIFQLLLLSVCSSLPTFEIECHYREEQEYRSIFSFCSLSLFSPLCTDMRSVWKRKTLSLHFHVSCFPRLLLM